MNIGSVFEAVTSSAGRALDVDAGKMSVWIPENSKKSHTVVVDLGYQSDTEDNSVFVSKAARLNDPLSKEGSRFSQSLRESFRALKTDDPVVSAVSTCFVQNVDTLGTAPGLTTELVERDDSTPLAAMAETAATDSQSDGSVPTSAPSPSPTIEIYTADISRRRGRDYSRRRSSNTFERGAAVHTGGLTLTLMAAVVQFFDLL